MANPEIVLGYLSGLRFLDPALPMSRLLGTMLVVNVCDAFLCRVVARNHGQSPNLWGALGLVFGVWAVGCLLLLTTRTPVPATEQAAGR